MDTPVALKSFHSKFLSAQPDGRAEWNRDIASVWEFFHVENRGDKIALKGTHGMYVSAQPDGSVQINRRVFDSDRIAVFSSLLFFFNLSIIDIFFSYVSHYIT